MTVLQITCDNCGAKYKLPETFTGSQAKCQKCGSVIDVQKQRAAAGSGTAASAPAAAKPAAAARPAIDRSKQAPTPAPSSKRVEPSKRSEAASASGRRGAKAGDEGSGGSGKRERGERPAKKSNSMPLILSGVGLLVIGVAAFLVFGGSGKPSTQTSADNKATPAAAGTPDPKPATPAPEANKPEAAKPDAKPDAGKTEPAKAETPPAGGANASNAEATKTEPTKTEPAEASAPAVPDAPTRVKRPWEKMKNPPQSMDQVADPKAYGEVQWPAGIDAAKKAEVQELAETAATDTGLKGSRAQKKLEQMGYPAMFAIVERLRLFDYKAAEDSMIAFSLNKSLEQITGGLNARFEPVEATETLVPAKAEWNTRSVRGWLDLLAKFPDEETFKKTKADLLKKQAGDDK
jgi:hypothetical protein